MKKLLLPLFVILVCLVCDTSPRAIAAATNLSPLPGSQLDNISTRAFVQTGDNVMIGGIHHPRYRTKDRDKRLGTVLVERRSCYESGGRGISVIEGI
jgi:hypothetical protein